MSSINGNGSLTEKPQIRLCHIIKWDDYDGYGFNLHAEKNKPGQYIGKVDEGSPAEAAGLKEGDKIIEVNGTNITSDDHKSVVNKIKQKPNETCLLVVDKTSAEYFAKNNVTITSSLPEVIAMKTPARPSKPTEKIESAEQNRTEEKIENNPVNSDVNGNKANGSTNGSNKTPSLASESPKSQKSVTSSEGSKEEKGKLMLNMSAEEFRNKLALRKKYDPKKENIDVKKKYEIIDQL